MGIFKRRKADEAFKIQLEREALDQMNHADEDGYVLPLQLEGENSVWNLQGKAKAPHTITAEELNGQTAKQAQPVSDAAGPVDQISMSKEQTPQSGSDFLFKRMSESRAQAAEQVITPPAEQASAPEAKTAEPSAQPAPTAPQKKNEDHLDIDALLRSLHEELNQTKSNLAGENADPPTTAEAPAKTASVPAEPQPEAETAQPTEAAPKNEASQAVEQIPVVPATPPVVDPTAAKRAEERRTSLLARCNAYLKDDEFGTAKIDTEKYKLESVESILQDFEARASHRVMKNLDLQTGAATPDKSMVPPISDPVTPTMPVATDKTQVPRTTSAFIIGADAPIEKDEQEPAPVKHYFTSPIPQEKQTPSVPDLSETKVLTDISSSSAEQKPEISGDQTAIFTAVEPPKAPKQKEQPKQTAPVEEAFPDDYRSVSDRDRILKDLTRSRSKLTGKVIGNLLLLIPAVCLLTPLAEAVKAISLPLYFALELFFALLAVLVNFSTLRSLAGLISAKADPELPAAVASIAVLLQSIVRFATEQAVTGFSAALLFALLIGTLTKRSYFTRVIRNFELIANSADKKAVAIVKSQAATKAVVGNSISGSALICCGAETTNLKNFLKYTYCADPAAGKIKLVTVIGLIAGLVLGLIAGITTGSVATGTSVFAAALCVVATPASLLLSNLPLNMAAGRLKLYDAMLTGHRAADELDLCNGIAVSCNDIFPEGTIRLVDMKLLSPNPIDKSMLDAAALADAIGSPLAGIFKQVSTAASYHNHKHKVDTIAYEDKMGISGWVDDRRVFVGNRILMEAHGFTNLPPVELDKKIMRKGYFPVYLVSDNVPCALLVVKYAPDEEIAYELRRLCNTGTTVFVHNCDPNISDQMLCDYFGLYPETVSVMSKQGAEQYQELVKYRREISAGAAYRGPISGLFATMTAAISVKRTVSVMTVLYVMLAVLGLLAIGVSIFTPLFAYLNTVSVLVYQLVTTLLVCLPPLLKRP